MVKEAAARSHEPVENLYRQHPRFDVAGSGGTARTIIVLVVTSIILVVTNIILRITSIILGVTSTRLGVRLGNDVNSQIALPGRSGDQLAGLLAPWTVPHRRSRLGFVHDFHHQKRTPQQSTPHAPDQSVN